jgi:uncharacterized membrane protein (TIGR02234 family)
VSTGRTARLTGRRTAVLLTLLGAGLVLLAGTRTWATVTVNGTLPGLTELTVSGRRSAPALIAIALAAVAGAVVLTTSGRTVRFLVAAGALVAGAGVAFTGIRAAGDTEGAAATAIRDSLRVLGSSQAGSDGLVGSVAGPAVSMSIWPWVAAFGGLLIAVAGGLTLAGGRSWPGPTRRYERPPGPGSSPSRTAAQTGTESPRTDTPAATWDALSRGEDPTSASEDRT